MRAVVQRVSRAEVRVKGKVVGKIGAGILVLVGIGLNDRPETARALAEKVTTLRILEDDQGKMNRSVLEARGSVLCVSQFTLYGDARRGRRPSYTEAAPLRPLSRSMKNSWRKCARWQPLMVLSSSLAASRP